MRPTNRSTGNSRDEFLSLQWFRNRVDAKVGIEQWRRHYNDVRPHSSLGYLTPLEFKRRGLPVAQWGARRRSRLALSRKTKNQQQKHLRQRTRQLAPFSSNSWSEESRQVTGITRARNLQYNKHTIAGRNRGSFETKS